MHWWNKAANLGYSESQYSLGCCYLYGKGVKKNSKIAKEWIAKAAAQGHEEAQKTLKTINTTNNHSNYTIPQINWRNISDTDQMLLNNDVDKCIRFLESIPSNELDEWEKETKKYALSLLKAPKLSIIPFDLINYKKVRSIQCHKYNNVYAQGYGVIEYDFFNCKFTIQTNNQLFFRKTSGSQRKSGHIYKKDSTSCIFLGGWSVNDDPQTKYGSENSQAGTLYRIAENKMLMVFYGSPDSFELYEIIK
jgi:hypothetical protein